MVALPTWPTDRTDASEDRWSKMMKRLFANGVHASTEYGEFRAYGDATGMQVKVDSGDGMIDGFHFESPSITTLGIGTADASLDRIDRVVLRLDHTTPATASLIVVQGTPQASPVAPPLSNTATDLPVAQVLVRHGTNTILATDVTDQRTYVMPRINEAAGIVHEFLGTVAPDGYLLLQGQTGVSTAAYPVLAKMLGATGSTMTLPDMRRKVPRGANGDVGATGGSDTASLTATNNGPHVHPIAGSLGNVILVSIGGDQANYLPPDPGNAPAGNWQVTATHIEPSGEGTPFSIVQAFVSLNYIVRAY